MTKSGHQSGHNVVNTHKLPPRAPRAPLSTATCAYALRWGRGDEDEEGAGTLAPSALRGWLTAPRRLLTCGLSFCARVWRAVRARSRFAWHAGGCLPTLVRLACAVSGAKLYAADYGG